MRIKMKYTFSHSQRTPKVYFLRFLVRFGRTSGESDTNTRLKIKSISF